MEEVLNICGIEPEGFVKIDISSDPNFVFENDPLFSAVTLYDVDGNVINVNSWVECAHYVNGGWTSVMETGYIGAFVLLQITAVLYLGYGLLRFINKDRIND